MFQGARRCIPCDVTHKEMKEKMNGLVIDRDLVKGAVEGNDSTLEIVLTTRAYAYEKTFELKVCGMRSFQIRENVNKRNKN